MSVSDVYEIPYTENDNFAGIEYPGPVNSVPRALKSLGGLEHVSRTLATPPNPASAIELNLNPKAKFSHPVQAGILDSGNIIMKVVKRRRKRPKLAEDGSLEEEGIYTMEAVGVATKTVRFRGMADFQYNPSTKPDDPILVMADAMRTMNVEAMAAFSFPAPDEDFTEDLYLPPSIFSRQGVPQMWEYKALSASVKTTSDRPGPSGEEVQRLINGTRWKGKPMVTIPFATPDVPTGPTEELIKLRRPVTKHSEAAALELLKRRPIWTRMGLLNEMPAEDARNATNQKQIVSLTGYTFADGPFRDLIIRFGYDPRTDPESRFYQHLSLRNVANVRSKKAVIPLVDVRSNPAKARDIPTRKEHLFDGKTPNGKIGNFQLCDLSDPLLESLVQSPAGVLPVCSGNAEGWYDPDYFEQIRKVLRHKWYAAHNGVVLDDADCAHLLGDPKVADGKSQGKKGKAVVKVQGSATSQDGESGADEESAGEGGDGDGDGSGSEVGASESASPKKRGSKGPGKKPKGRTKASWEAGKKKLTSARRPAVGETAEEKVSSLPAPDIAIREKERLT
ncbi:hypothetical protein RQP46_006049 [Phenoliferia psychrophenolica]